MSSTASEESARPGCLEYLVFWAVSGWIVTVAIGTQAALWFADQLLLIEGTPPPAFVWPVLSWVQALLLALPVLPLAALTRAPVLRAAYRTWALAIAYLATLALVRFVPKTWTQPAAVAQLALSLLCLLALLALARRRYRPAWRGPLALPLALVPALAAPWLAFGALGSPLDTALGLLAGLALGAFAGVLLEAFLFRPLDESAAGPGRSVAFGALAAGLALLILAAGFGFDGGQLLLLAALPPLGIALAALDGLTRSEPAGRRWLPSATLVGLVAAAPLALVDPDELTLLLGDGDVLSWALRAAGWAFALALVLGLALWWLGRRGAGRLDPPVAVPAIAWAGAMLLYLAVGQPGFYGEHLFVILRDQPDLSAARAVADRGERARLVYETLTRHAATTQSGLRTTLDRLGVEYRPYYLVNALDVRGGPLLRLYLSRQPEVDRVLDSPRLRPLPAPPPAAVGDAPAPGAPEWNITAIGADRVWRELGVTGRGIVVGQMDSGVEGSHPALRDGYRGRAAGDDYNWLDPWRGTRSPVDVGGHGTHTLGSVLGRENVGVAPDAEWFACVNLARNLGNPAYYLDCMQFTLAPYPQGGDPFVDGDPSRAAHVANNSWGCPPIEGCDAGSLRPAVAALRAAGIFVVASAGNEGPRCASVSDPIAIYDEAFSVGAVDRAGDLAPFSSRGPVEVDGSGRVKPDLVAPGVEVLSAYPAGTYRYESGTSMAGPHVAGVVALMWSAQPRLIGDVERTEQILVETARPYAGPAEGCSVDGRPSNDAGYGVVDAYAAVRAALALR